MHTHQEVTQTTVIEFWVQLNYCAKLAIATIVHLKIITNDLSRETRTYIIAGKFFHWSTDCQQLCKLRFICFVFFLCLCKVRLHSCLRILGAPSHTTTEALALDPVPQAPRVFPTVNSVFEIKDCNTGYWQFHYGMRHWPFPGLLHPMSEIHGCASVRPPPLTWLLAQPFPIINKTTRRAYASAKPNVVQIGTPDPDSDLDDFQNLTESSLSRIHLS